MNEIVKTIGESIKEQVSGAAGGDKLEVTVKDGINAVLGIIGIVCVVFIIIGGVNMTMSQGDPGKIAKAKNTIIYSIIGLVVVLISFAIVNFVLDIF